MSGYMERPLEPRQGREPTCPLCGTENPAQLYTVPGQGLVGCDLCLCVWDAADYFADLREEGEL